MSTRETKIADLERNRRNASLSDIRHRFGFHAATTEEKKMEHGSIRSITLSIAEVYDRDLPDGREKALAITKLEEAMFWANAAIARNNTGE